MNTNKQGKAGVREHTKIDENPREIGVLPTINEIVKAVLSIFE